MKKLQALLLACLFAVNLWAQPTYTNTAFKNGETVHYTLKFNWGAIWINVGTASWNVTGGTYGGKTAHKVTLKTMTNKTADKYFVMRDTLTTYVSPQLVPLYHEKRGREGKRYTRDWVKYSYKGGKCNVSTYHKVNQKPPMNTSYSSTTPAYDMMSMMLRARSMDPTGWKVGHRESFVMAEGNKCSQQSIVYRGKETVKVEGSGGKYRCLVFSFMEKEKGKEKEIVKFFISDDANHLPIRLDMNLTFGSAKAFLTSCSGIRNPQTAKI